MAARIEELRARLPPGVAEPVTMRHELTVLQEAFAVAYVALGTQEDARAEAYRKAHAQAAKAAPQDLRLNNGRHLTRLGCQQNAKNLLRLPRVAARIAELLASSSAAEDLDVS